MGNADSSFTPTTGSAPRSSRGVEPASARCWWRTRGKSHAHHRHHASSCGFDSLGGLGHQSEARACSQQAKSYWCELPWGGDDDVFLDMSGCSAHFSAHASSSSLPAGDATGHASCSSSARTEDSGLGDSLILQVEGTEAVEGAWSRLHSVASTGSGGGSGVPPCGSGRKDYLKKRIRQLGDWTGSLSRKKRRVQVRQWCHPVDKAGNDVTLPCRESVQQHHFPLCLYNSHDIWPIRKSWNTTYGIFFFFFFSCSISSGHWKKKIGPMPCCQSCIQVFLIHS